MSVTPGRRRPSAQSPIYIYTPSLSSEPFSFPSLFSHVIPVFLLSWFACLLPSDSQPRVNRLGSRPPFAHYRRSLLPLSLHWWQLLPCLTSASHSGQLMDTLLLLYIYLCSSTIPLVSVYLPPTPLLLPIFSSPTSNLSKFNTHHSRCRSLHNKIKDIKEFCVYIYRVCVCVWRNRERVIETSTITSHRSFLCHLTYLPH